MNPKRRVCKITNNFQKAGVILWQSTVLGRLWHRITDATQDANLWPAPKIERQDKSLQKITKVSQKSFGTVFMDQWDKDEPLSKWRESKNVEKKKGTAKDPKLTAQL